MQSGILGITMAAHRNDWRLTIALFAITGLVESLAWGHLSAFTPLYLRELGVASAHIGYWTGLTSSVGWIIGLPLLPFWGVWADRYSRKLIIVRSSIMAAVVYALCAASNDVWMMALGRALGGFVLGNTGVMMAVQADITPRAKLGTAIAIVSAGSPIGMAVGPYLGGLIVRHSDVRSLLYLDALLTAVVAVLLIVFLREEPREPSEHRNSLVGVRHALRALIHTPAVNRIFLATLLMSFGISTALPYMPLLVEHLFVGSVSDLAPTIGAVLTCSGIVMAVATPAWGAVGDRFGHMRALRVCGLLIAASLAAQAVCSSVNQLALAQAAQGAFRGGVFSLAMVLLTLRSPANVRSSILSLSLVPQQIGWFLGPLTGTLLFSAGLRAPFWAAAALCLAGWFVMLRIGSDHPVKESV